MVLQATFLLHLYLNNDDQMPLPSLVLYVSILIREVHYVHRFHNESCTCMLCNMFINQAIRQLKTMAIPIQNSLWVQRQCYVNFPNSDNLCSEADTKSFATSFKFNSSVNCLWTWSTIKWLRRSWFMVVLKNVLTRLKALNEANCISSWHH